MVKTTSVNDPKGLAVSFGIERAVHVNGNLVTPTSLNISCLGPGASAGAVELASWGSSLTQIGSGNVAMAPVSATTLGTIVQNTVDGQRIQNVTAVYATVNRVQQLRSQTLESSLRSAVIDSLRRWAPAPGTCARRKIRKGMRPRWTSEPCLVFFCAAAQHRGRIATSRPWT